MRRKLLLLSLSLLLFVSAQPFAGAQQISHGIALAWSWTGTGTATYNVYRSTTAGGETQPPYAAGVSGGTAPCVEGNTTLPNPCWMDPAPVVGTKYFYTVSAVVGGSESGPSAEVSAQISPPSAPANPQTAVH